MGAAVDGVVGEGDGLGYVVVAGPGCLGEVGELVDFVVVGIRHRGLAGGGHGLTQAVGEVGVVDRALGGGDTEDAALGAVSKILAKVRSSLMAGHVSGSYGFCSGIYFVRGNGAMVQPIAPYQVCLMALGHER